MNDKYIENMSETQIKRYEKRLYPTANAHGYFGCSSVNGFLAEGEKLLEVVTRDLETLNHYNISISKLADRIFNLTSTAINEMNNIKKTTVIIEEKYEIKVDICLGWQYCPFSDISDDYIAGRLIHINNHCDRNNLIFSIKNIINGEEIKFGGLLVHLIKDHHFFEGNVENRLDPLKIASILDFHV